MLYGNKPNDVCRMREALTPVVKETAKREVRKEVLWNSVRYFVLELRFSQRWLLGCNAVLLGGTYPIHLQGRWVMKARSHKQATCWPSYKSTSSSSPSGSNSRRSKLSLTPLLPISSLSYSSALKKKKTICSSETSLFLRNTLRSTSKTTHKIFRVIFLNLYSLILW